MSVRWLPAFILILLLGCSLWGSRKAPVKSIPDDMTIEEKIESLEQMKVDYPNDPNVYYTLGNLYYDQLLAVDARTNYEMALKLDPKMNKARVNLAMVLLEADEVDSAKAQLEEALRIDPKDSRAHSNLGLLYYTEKDAAKAVLHLKIAIELDPRCMEAHYNLGFAFAESGLLLEALAEWRKVVEIAPESTTAEQAKTAMDRVERLLKQ